MTEAPSTQESENLKKDSFFTNLKLPILEEDIKSLVAKPLLQSPPFINLSDGDRIFHSTRVHSTTQQLEEIW